MSTHLIFGCQSITGGSSLRKSLRLIHCALDLGITRFDVAPSYGMGTAETVLGTGLRGWPRSRVATKAGIEPPAWGRIYALAREPVRLMRKMVGNTSGYTPSSSRSAEKELQYSKVDVAASLQRSRAALGAASIDTWLTHEALATSSLDAFLEISRLEVQRGTLTQFGYSGGARAVQHNATYLGTTDAVVQCSLADAPAFAGIKDIRLFGVVGTLAPIIGSRVQSNAVYLDELKQAFEVNALQPQHVFVACIAAARAMSPTASLVISSSREDTLIVTVNALSSRRLTSWAIRYAGVHRSTGWTAIGA